MVNLVATKVSLPHFDLAVTDACAFLGLTRSAFFDYGQRHIDDLNRRTLQADLVDADTYYTAGTDDWNRGAICSQILLQASNDLIWYGVGSFAESPGAAILDFGCGTALPSFAYRHRFAQLLLCEASPLTRQFLQWRITHHGAANVHVLPPDQLPHIPPMQAMVVMDVMEHIPACSELFAELDAKLVPQGVLLFNAPWASVWPAAEHLPEAEADWHRPGGGASMLEQGYLLVQKWDHGGAYRKRG